MAFPCVIDVHAHIVFEELHGSAGDYGPEAMKDEEGVDCFRIGDYTLKPLSYAETVFTNLDLRIEHMDRLGIDLQVLSPNPLTMMHGIEAEVAHSFCVQQNDLMALQVAARHDRFRGLAALPMQDIDAACQELERSVSNLGLSGACVGTDFPHGFASTGMDALYRKFVELDVPLFIHPSSTDGSRGLHDKRLEPHALSLSLGYAYEETLAVATIILGGVLDRHPDLDICVSHGGGCVSFLSEKFDHLAKYDSSVAAGVTAQGFLHHLRRLWFDTHVHGDRSRQLLTEYVGNNKLVFGTNLGGFDSPEIIPEYALTLSDNARRLLRLS